MGARWIASLVGLAVVGCACSDEVASDPPVEVPTARGWTEPHVERITDPASATIAAGGGVVVVEVEAGLVAFDVARRAAEPVFPAEIDGARVLTASFPRHGVSADGRFVAAACAIASTREGAPALEHAICVRDRRGDAHLVRAPRSALGSADVWLSGDGSTLVVRSVDAGRTRILRAAREDRELREVLTHETSAGGAHEPAPRILDVAHDGAFLLGQRAHAASDVVDVELVRGDEAPRRLAAELAPLDARFASREGAAVDLVVDVGGELPMRRRLDVASGVVGEPVRMPEESRSLVSSPSRVATTDGRTLRIEGEGAPRRELPLPAGVEDVRLRAIADDGAVLATAAIAGRSCVVLLGGAEPVTVGCAE